jgi:hypothetical protein
VRSKITSCLLPTTSQAWLHVVAAIFTIGPGTAAIMSTSRYIRKRNTVVVAYLYRITRIYVLASLADADPRLDHHAVAAPFQQTVDPAPSG